MFVFSVYSLLIGFTLNTISPLLISKLQSSLSPVLSLNCFIMLIGTVVLRDSLPVVAVVSVDNSPILFTSVWVNTCVQTFLSLPTILPQSL